MPKPFEVAELLKTAECNSHVHWVRQAEIGRLGCDPCGHSDDAGQIIQLGVFLQNSDLVHCLSGLASNLASSRKVLDFVSAITGICEIAAQESGVRDSCPRGHPELLAAHGYFYDTFAYEICLYGIYFYGIYIYGIYFYRALNILSIDCTVIRNTWKCKYTECVYLISGKSQ